jgi:hypothetical protein
LTLGAGYVTWDPAFQFTNVHSDTVTIEPYRYLRYTAGNTQVTYYSNHDNYNSFWDYDNIDGTSDDYVVEVKYEGGYRYGYAFTGFPMTHYRIQAYAVGNTLYDDITNGGAGYNLTTLTDPVYAQSEFAFQPEAVTLAQNQAALYWLSSKVILVNNSAADHPTDIDLEVKAISANEFNTDQNFADTDASINYSSITYAVNGAGTASTEAKVTVAEITGGIIESGVDATLESVLDTRYWEIFYDTRRTASMASITFTYDVAADGIVDEEQLTVVFRADYSDDWTAWENVVVNEVDNTITANDVDTSAGQWAFAVVDNIAPTMTITSAEGADGFTSNDATLSLTFISSEATTDFAEEDITVTNGALSNFAATSSTVYTATFTPVANGEATIDVAASTFTDAAGNNNTAADQFNWTYDATVPTMTITSAEGADGFTSNDATLSLTFISSEATTDFAEEDITVTNGALSNFAATSSTVYTATFTPVANGEATIDVAASTFTDAAGNNNTAADQFNWTYDPNVSVEEEFIPTEFALQQNYPNPFNPITTLRYDLPEQATVNIIIYDIMGREVRTLVNTIQDAGFKSIIWNATNDFGKPVSAGVYLYQIQAGDFVQTRKMVLLK